MNARAIIESFDSLVVVDVQPAMAKHYSHDYARRVVAAMNEAPRVLAYFVGREIGYPDTAEDVREYFVELGLEDADKVQFVEKTYGWFRDRIDADDPYEEIVADVKVGLETDDWEPAGGCPDDSVLSSLPRYRFANLAGGEAGSCVDEIQILGDAMGLRLKRINSLVY